MGLSSNVMNMKFMQKAQDKSKTEDRQPEGKKVKDASEWSLPSGALKQKLKPAVTIKTVGYGSIASLTAKDDDSDSDEKPKPKTSPLPEKPKTSKTEEAQNFLSGILDKAHKDKKRSQKQNKQPRKKAKTSLS